MSQKALEDLQREYPINLHERRGRKSASSGLHQTHQVATHESLVVLEDAHNEPSIEQPESGQRLIKQFFQLFVSGEIEHRLDGFTPAAQAHLIDEIKAGIPLLEEFVAKNKIIEVFDLQIARLIFSECDRNDFMFCMAPRSCASLLEMRCE